MTATAWLPVLLALLSGLFAAVLADRLRPQVAVRLLSVALVGGALAVAAALSMAAMGAADHLVGVSALFGWCEALAEPHHHVPTYIGAVSAAAIVIGVARVSLWHRHRRAVTRDLVPVGEPVAVVPTDEVAAFAVPGKPGHIVVTTGMLECLNRREQTALLAHEQAHLDHRHSRYVGLAETAARAVPILHPLRRRVQFCTERWADEVAAATVGDREAVATAIARAALMRSSSAAPSLELAGHGVAARVAALLNPPTGGARREAIGLPVSALVTAGAAVVQLHHLVTFAAHVC